MTRKKARDLAFKLLYQCEIQKEPPAYILEIYTSEHQIGEAEKEYVESVLYGVHGKKEALSELVSGCLAGWRLERISKVTLCAILLSVYEILSMPDIPDAVSINEAVSLVKRYEGGEAVGFVNGVLSSVLKKKEAGV